MLSGIGPTQVGIIVAVVVAVAYVWSASGRGRWYDVLSERFIYGVPWGTLVSVAGVVAFYLVAQSGLGHWGSPAITPFRSWSYGYPIGMLTSGFAHAGPDHLIGNMVGTVVLAPVVEYAFSHYPPRLADDEESFRFAPPSEAAEPTGVVGYEVPDEPRLRDRPWVRALVIFPAAVVVVSLLTSVLALGWSLGFSGTVFAFGGFAVVYAPLAAIAATIGLTGVGTIVAALRDPVLRATTSGGAPGPPSWAGINVQAHLLGFLIGVLLAYALLVHRDERRTAGVTFLAVAVFAFSRGLWSLALSGDGVFFQYRGIGTVFVLALTIIVTATVSKRSAPETSVLPGSVGDGPVLGRLRAVDNRVGSAIPVTNQHILIVGLVLVTLVVALPSVAGNGLPMADDPVPEGGGIEVADYTVTYAEDTPHGRVGGNESGVIVVSERRQVWTTAADKSQLARSGEATVVLGGVGWRETVTANRTGWSVTGGEAVYVVDLTHDGARTRSFTADQVEADVRIANRTVAVDPGEDGFSLNVTREGEQVGESAVPAVNETATIGGIEFVTEPDDDTVAVYAEHDGTRVRIATREQY